MQTYMHVDLYSKNSMWQIWFLFKNYNNFVQRNYFLKCMFNSFAHTVIIKNFQI